MLHGRSKKILFSTLMRLWIISLIAACGSPAAITPTAVLYTPSLPPDPVSKVETTVRAEPELSDEYFPNPGIGWQKGSETPDSLNVPESVAYAHRREIGWSVLNPAEDVYDWTALNQALEAATQAGKQFSFRVYTMVGEKYGGHMIPNWVLDKGATLLPSSHEPDYSNCVYQEQWGKFVNELRHVYDGNPDIAFIDISGYGNFNEWSWEDAQTEWDDAWENGFLHGFAAPEQFETLDGQARRRLADMFIGGSYPAHQCRLANGQTSVIQYSYEGFQKTQLVMPYAGIIQSSQYVLWKRNDVGFRHDCLGRDGEKVLEKAGDVISQVWVRAPVVFEFCKPEEFSLEDAKMLVQRAHASLIHDNNWAFGSDSLEGLLHDTGYRYFLKEATWHASGQTVGVRMTWQNVGDAPSYPKMGQEFQLYLCLMDAAGTIIHKEWVPVDISRWLPARQPDAAPPLYAVLHTVQLPFPLSKGTYYAGVSIVDMRTGKPINLAFGGKDSAGWYRVSSLEIQ